MRNISATKKQRLGDLERTVREGYQAFYSNGALLREIHDWELYKPEFESWRSYCRGKWDLSEREAQKLMDVATIQGLLSGSAQ